MIFHFHQFLYAFDSLPIGMLWDSLGSLGDGDDFMRFYHPNIISKWNFGSQPFITDYIISVSSMVSDLDYKRNA